MLRLWPRVRGSNNRGFRKNNPDIMCLSNLWGHSPQKTVDQDKAQFLVNLLGITELQACKILSEFRGRRKPTEADISKSLAICVKFGIDHIVKSKMPIVVLIKPIILEQRINFYKDLGCPDIPPIMIAPFFASIRLSVTSLKEREMIPKDLNVAETFLNCLHKAPAHVPPPDPMPEDRSLGEIHHNILRHYLTWKFELTEEQFYKILNNKSTVKYQSFSMIRKMIDLLENEFKFTKQKIIRNNYLIFKSPFNTQQILEEIDHIGLLDIKSIILKYPRLLHVQAEKLQEKIKILEDFNVTKEAISKCPSLLTLSVKTIQSRFIEFEAMQTEIEELRGHLAHPRLLMLIFYFNRVKKRIETLKALNVRCTSFHILCSGDGAFQRYTVAGSDRTKGKDLLRFLCSELGLDFLDSRIALIKRHSFWCQIPFHTTHNTVVYLKSQNYSSEDIIENIYIVLYRSSQIDAELTKLESLKLENESWVLTPSKKLAICLYYLEKPYHFDGNAVWNCHPEASTQAANEEEEPNSRFLRQTSTV